MENRDLLEVELNNLRGRLDEALDALNAIRRGQVDALVVYEGGREQVYTLQGAEQPYRVMVEAMNEGAATLSGDGVVLWGNVCLADLLQRPLPTILGSTLSSYLAPEGRQVFDAILAARKFANGDAPPGPKSRSLSKAEIEIETPDGERVPVLLSVSPLNSDSSLTFTVLLTDLSEQKRNVEITAAERLASAIIEQAGEGIVVCDQSGIVIRASQAAARLAGQNPLLKPFERAFPLSFAVELSAGRPFSLAAVMQGEVFRGLEARLEVAAPGGQVEDYHLLLSAAPLVVNDSQVSACVITLVDQTAQKQAEESVRRYARRLERSNKDLQDFAFVASHDLKEPLRKIQSFGQQLVRNYKDALENEGCDYIDRMQNAADRMETMINDLLAYSRISTSQQEFGPIDLKLVAQEAISDLEVRAINVKAVIELGELPTVQADRTQMYQLLQNLIGNALKFHKPGQLPEVRVSSHNLDDGRVEILVSDNGIGFSMEFAERVFQPFQRLHGRSEYEGSGIGLPICRRIVERHRGDINVQSVLGEGTTFTVILPMDPDRNGI